MCAKFCDIIYPSICTISPRRPHLDTFLRTHARCFACCVLSLKTHASVSPYSFAKLWHKQRAVCLLHTRTFCERCRAMIQLIGTRKGRINTTHTRVYRFGQIMGHDRSNKYHSDGLRGKTRRTLCTGWPKLGCGDRTCMNFANILRQ